MNMKAQIESKLTEAFEPVELEVIDESEQHRGHGGWREGGETHFRVRMAAAAFAGQSRVARQ
ncbi:MAG: BolA family protein, partial [Pseudomonadota bacterium]